MANIKDLKKKIKSTKGTLKITTAMKLVSAAKLAKAQQNIQSARPYANELETSIKEISALVDNYSHQYLEGNEENKRTALLVYSANKGLCGGFNSSVVKAVRKYVANSDLDIKVYFIGKKAKDILAKELNCGKHYTFDRVDPTYEEVVDVGEELAEQFVTGEIGRVLVAYNIFKSAIAFDTSIKQVLPLQLDLEEAEKIKGEFPFDFKYEPAPKEILDALIPQTYLSTLWTSQLDSVAAEHGSRMSAMDSAVSNCKEAVRSLTLKMNKLRQAAITTELSEVVSGAESLNG